jgi:hypothetical protein
MSHQDKFHMDVKTHNLIVFSASDGSFTERISLGDRPIADLSFTPSRLLVHFSAVYNENSPTAVFKKISQDEDEVEDGGYEEARLHCPHLWNRNHICGCGADDGGGGITVLGRKREGDTDLLVLRSDDQGCDSTYNV